MEISRVGVDLAKNVFQLHGVNQAGKGVWRRKFTRERWITELVEVVKPGTEIGMEACSGANHWARKLTKLGYKVIIIPPQFVKPFVKSNKNDANDARAICEAMARPEMHSVKIKTVEQQNILAVHRIREDIKSQRVAKANQIRGLVAEYGLVTSTNLSQLRKAIPQWLESTEDELTPFFKELLFGLWSDLKTLDSRMSELDKQIQLLGRDSKPIERLQQLRGVGPIIASALVGTIGDGKQYKKGREMSAAIGLTPKQHSSGGKDRLLGISKRGDAYLRSLLIHGARAVIQSSQGKDDRLSRWITGLLERRHHNVVCVALANKIARMAWVMLTKEVDFDPNYEQAMVC